MNPFSMLCPGKPHGRVLSQWSGQLALLGLAGFILARSPALAAEKVPLAVAREALPFGLQQVRLLDGPFREAMLRNRAYLLSLDPDRLLHTFRLNAGLPSTVQPYGGWEEPKCELRGHSLGHYLTACALMYANTGEKAFQQRAHLLVAELAKCQAAAPQRGFHAGYLSAFPESFIDRVEARQSVWAPWYTLHKIYAGLLDTYQLCGNPQALEVLVRAADWIQSRVDHLSGDQMQKCLDTEFGGMNEVLANLYAVTGNPQHLRLARAFDHQRIFTPLAQREDRLDGQHANTQIPKIIGAARAYELTGEAPYREIAQYFWQRVAQHRSYVIGGHSDGEHFFPVTEFAKHLSPATAETCNTYNLLRLTRQLFSWEPSVQVMDFYERALYNHILASQDPQKGMFVYLMSLKPGHFKTYSLPEDSFWCCVGTGMENHAKYADTIYFQGADSLYVNLFIPSELTWKEKGLVMRQDTRFPESDTTRLTLQCQQPVALALKVRYPAWAAGAMSVTINGQRQEIAEVPGSYVTLQREWRDGDQIQIRLPLALHVETLPGEDNLVALLYGPVVLAAELGTEGMPDPYARNQTAQLHVPSPAVPVFVCNAQELVRCTAPVANQPLTFRTQGLGQPREVTLIPFYRLHHQRYSVYWRLFSPAGWQQQQATIAAAEAQRKALEARIVDTVQPGEQQPEIDHQLQGEKTQSGDFNQRKWRHASEGGWFSYQLKSLPDQPLVLACTYWGGDDGPREFDILVDGQKVGTQKLNNNQPGEFFAVHYALPASLTSGKQQLTLRFQAHPAKTAGGLFGCALLKAKP